jgi:hypothetical protein
MCLANQKRWFDYERLDRTYYYIHALSEATATNPDNLVISVKGGIPELQGTWIHPRLAVDLARWISPAFAVWMDGWFLESTFGTCAGSSLPPGVHVVASSQRQASWLWKQAVEAEVSASLMRALAYEGRNPASRSTFQLHLLPA